MRKPLIRWIIGPVANEGFDALRLSYKLIKKIYGNKFDYLICHNGLSDKDIQKLPPISKFNQNSLFNVTSNNYFPSWKLCPPRLNIKTHEIILDNDVIIYDKLFDEFLTDDRIFITEAFARSYSSEIKKSIPENFNINCGVVCYPPLFDPKNEINLFLNKHNFNMNFEEFIKHYAHKNSFFDDQTLIAEIIHKHSPYLISLNKVSVLCDEYKLGQFGSHFVGLNRGNKIYWKKFCKEFLI